MLQTLFCCPACQQGLVTIQDVSGNRTSCYQMIIDMNLKGIGWRNYCFGSTFQQHPMQRIFPGLHVWSTSSAQIVTFSASFLQSIRFLCAPSHVGVFAINYTLVHSSHVSYLSLSHFHLGITLLVQSELFWYVHSHEGIL